MSEGDIQKLIVALANLILLSIVGWLLIEIFFDWLRALVKHHLMRKHGLSEAEYDRIIGG